MIKYGGHAMEDPALADLFAQDVVLMRLVGMNPVVVHGGGPQISDLMRRLGKEPEFVDGLRVTDAESVDIVRMALVGKVNREIVAALNQHGSYAVGLSGEDAGLIKVEMRDERLGFVGDVTSIDPSIVHKLLNEELIPVIATVGRRRAGSGLQHQRRHRGRRDRAGDAARRSSCTSPTSPASTPTTRDESSLISGSTSTGSRRCSPTGKADGGMIPKLESCVARAARRRATRARPRRSHPARAPAGVLHP